MRLLMQKCESSIFTVRRCSLDASSNKNYTEDQTVSLSQTPWAFCSAVGGIAILETDFNKYFCLISLFS